jgi:hypothetical protein
MCCPPTLACSPTLNHLQDTVPGISAETPLPAADIAQDGSDPTNAATLDAVGDPVASDSGSEDAAIPPEDSVSPIVSDISDPVAQGAGNTTAQKTGQSCS